MSDATTANPPGQTAAAAEGDLEGLAARVDEAVAEVHSLDEAARDKALALKTAVEAFHKGGLTHIIRTLKADPRGEELLYALVDEPAVYALFAMHGLVRADLPSRVAQAIESVRPYMQSHGGDVTFLEVQDNKAVVRLEGSCNGCSMSSVTLKNTVEEALKEHVPELDGVVVADQDAGPLVQITLPADAADDSKGWIEGPLVDEVTAERPFAFESGDDKILLLKSSKGLRAYRNACAHQGLPLDGGMLDPESGVITCPWHGFQFDGESGECYSAPHCQLEPFPLRVEAGRVFVRPQ